MKKTYAKLIDGQFIIAPSVIVRDGYRTANPTPAMLRELGYKEVIYPAPDEAVESAEVTPQQDKNIPMREVYTEQADCIRVSYVAGVTEPVPALPYEERVETLIRERYTVSDELAILRQRDTKPEEFAAYFAFCEECKARIKEQME